MNITKFGHSCLLVEEGKARIMIDPGSYSNLQNGAEKIDAILITHEHQDHINIESLKAILQKNKHAVIYTNSGVGAVLDEAKISYKKLENKEEVKVKGVLIEGFGETHEHIYHGFTDVPNTGYRIAEKFFYGGDSLKNIVKCDILAYPAAAPWGKVEWMIDYAKAVKPKVCIPVHDAFLKFPGPYYSLPAKILKEEGIEWVVIEEGKTWSDA